MKPEVKISDDLRKFINGIPKIELHVHIEGAFSPGYSAALAEKEGVPLRNGSKEHLFDFVHLADFLELLDWNCALVRSFEEASSLAYTFAKYFTSQNVLYAEVITNPTHWSSLSHEEHIGGILDGFERAAQDGLCDCRLLVSLLRTQSTESAEETADWVISHPHERMIGMSVDGNEEAAQSNERFAPILKKAKDAGLRLTMHAGESSPAEGVREAIELAGAERIDHGVRAIDDPALIKKIKDERIALNVCLYSNVALDVFTYENHPLKRLYDEGVLVTVNTDDPQLLDFTLDEELALVCSLYGWGKEDVRRLELNAVEACFCCQELNDKLRKLLEDLN